MDESPLATSKSCTNKTLALHQLPWGLRSRKRVFLALVEMIMKPQAAMLMRWSYEFKNARYHRLQYTRSWFSSVPPFLQQLHLDHEPRLPLPPRSLYSLLALPNGLMNRRCIGSSPVHGDGCIIIIRLQEDVRNGSHCKVCSPFSGPLLGSLKGRAKH